LKAGNIPRPGERNTKVPCLGGRKSCAGKKKATARPMTSEIKKKNENGISMQQKSSPWHWKEKKGPGKKAREKKGVASAKPPKIVLGS